MEEKSSDQKKNRKLRTADSRKEYYGSRLRQGKADNKLTDDEIKKSKKLKQQSQKKGMEVYKETSKAVIKAAATASVVGSRMLSMVEKSGIQGDGSDKRHDQRHDI